MDKVEDLWYWGNELSKFDPKRQDRYTPEYIELHKKRQESFDRDFAALSFSEQHRFFTGAVLRPRSYLSRIW